MYVDHYTVDLLKDVINQLTLGCILSTIFPGIPFCGFVSYIITCVCMMCVCVCLCVYNEVVNGIMINDAVLWLSL